MVASSRIRSLLALHCRTAARCSAVHSLARGPRLLGLWVHLSGYPVTHSLAGVYLPQRFGFSSTGRLSVDCPALPVSVTCAPAPNLTAALVLVHRLECSLRAS